MKIRFGATIVLTSILIVSNCKTRSSQSALRGEENNKVAAKLDDTYLKLAQFRQRVEQFYVPKFVDNTFFYAVKHQELLDAELMYEASLDALESLGIAVSEMRSLNLDAKAQRSILVKRPDIRTGLRYFEASKALMEYCADVVVLKEDSYDHYYREISTTPLTPWGEDSLESSSLGDFYSQDNLRTLMWNLAGRPRVTATINSEDVYRFGVGNENTVSGSTGELEARAGDKCTDEVKVHTPEEVTKNPGAMREKKWVSTLINDCPPKIVWKSGVWTSAMSNITNLKPMHEYAIKYCPMIFVTIDETRIDSVPTRLAATTGRGGNISVLARAGRKDISEIGQTRRMTKDAYLARLDEMILNIDLKRKSLRKGEDF
jgi:hypothetical protein